MRTRTIRATTGLLVALILGFGTATASHAATVKAACKELDRSYAASCKLEHKRRDRASRNVWQLTTRLVVGEGSRDKVEAVEKQFCQMVSTRGGRGRFTRWSHVPGHAEGAAKVERSCPMKNTLGG